MSITKYQYPAGTTMRRYIHQMIYPEYYTGLSTNYSSYSDFKYRFSLVDSTGVLNYFKQSPNINGVGSFNPCDVMSSYVSSYFNPLITAWTDVTAYGLKQYRVDVEEFYGGEVKTATLQSYFKAFISNATKKDYDYSENLLNTTTSKFLTNQSSNQTIRLRLKDYATVRFLNGTFTYLSSSTYKSRPYKLRFQLTRGSNVYVYESLTNPWWSNQTPLNSSATTFDSMKGRVVEYPVGPANLASMNFYLISVNGTSVGPTLISGSTIKVGDKYEVWAYCAPYGDQSQHYKYEIVCVDETFNNRVILYWENEYGGWSQFLLEMRNTETSKVERFGYRKNYDEFGKASQTTSSYYIGHNDYSRQSTIYGGEEVINLTAFTDWLTADDLYYFKDLWRSRNVYINYRDTFYPVITLNEGERIRNSRDELYQIPINLEFANKNMF